MSAGRPIPIGSTFQVQALLYSESQGSVVVAPLQKFDPIRLDEIDAAVLPADATRPDARTEVLERFGLTDARNRIAQHGTHPLQQAEGCPAIGVDPGLQEIRRAHV